ncbi:MAG: inositol monophosphatase family protein [Aggregatilineales bacterium]
MDLQPIIAAVRQSVALCREVQNSHIVRNDKVGREPVTIADYGTQAIVNRAIMLHFPDDSIISEESGTQFAELVDAEQQDLIVKLVSAIIRETVTVDDLILWLDHGKRADADSVTQPRTWLVDPVDGTKGFIALRHYVIGVGFLQDSQPTAAVVGAPAYPDSAGVMFHAVDGKAYMRFLGGGALQEISVTQTSDVPLIRALESVEKGHVGHQRLARVRELCGFPEEYVKQADSMEKYCRVAAGDAELYLRLSRLKSTRPHMVWDHLPGALMVTNAGGTVSGLSGEPLDYSRGKVLHNEGVIATNGQIHDEVVEAVQTLLEEEAQVAED